MTGVVSQQSVLVDRISCQALEVGHSATDESDELSGNELLIDGASDSLENVSASMLDNSEAKTVVYVQFVGVCRPKGHPCPASCVIKRSGGGECSSYHGNPQPQRIRDNHAPCIDCQRET